MPDSTNDGGRCTNEGRCCTNEGWCWGWVSSSLTGGSFPPLLLLLLQPIRYIAKCAATSIDMCGLLPRGCNEVGGGQTCGYWTYHAGFVQHRGQTGTGTEFPTRGLPVPNPTHYTISVHVIGSCECIAKIDPIQQNKVKEMVSPEWSTGIHVSHASITKSIYIMALMITI